MIRFADLIFSFIGLLILLPLLIVIFLLCFFDTGRPLFIQKRVGHKQRTFKIIKFRSMQVDAPSVASHLAIDSSITKFGKLIRRSKMDELPQLWNVMIGQMSLVGPRPCLLNQKRLITERKKLGVFNARPGITGLAQLKGVDMSKPKRLAEIDAAMIKSLTFTIYLKFILLTVLGVKSKFI